MPRNLDKINAPDRTSESLNFVRLALDFILTGNSLFRKRQDFASLIVVRSNRMRHSRVKKEGPKVIEFRDVGYAYGVQALLEGVSLDIPQGSFHFLTGPSGSGKTTFIKMCYAELQATAGFVKVFGKTVQRMDRDGVAFMRRNIGVVHQDCQFLDHLSVSENIALPQTVSGQGNQKSIVNLSELLQWVGLTHVEQALPPSLSGGERQRAALARALINAPDIILADEPTGNVDWDMSQRLLRLLIELNKMGKTVLFATHDLGLIRVAKKHVQARVLRIQDKQLWLAGADL